MSSDPRSSQPGAYDPTRPLSSTPAPSANQQVPSNGIPAQNLPPPPARAASASSSRRPFILAGIAIVLILVIVGGAVVIGAQINSYNSVVSKYYAAVQQRDYTKAYSYISFPGAFTAQGVRLYTAVAQGLDKTSGPVSSYSQQSSSGSGENATVLETVQRPNRSYTVRLTLISVNGEWKITNFSSI